MKYLIYGATRGRGSGIGARVAAVLAERGHDVLGLGRNPGKCGSEERFALESLDIREASGQDRLKQLMREFYPDVIWSACGTGFDVPLWALDDDQLEQTIDANIRNAAIFCRVCAPSCVDGGPHLVLTGSIAGMVDGVGAALYAGTKGFLRPFVRAQAMEYARLGKQAKISLLAFHSVEIVGIGAIADALEYIGKLHRPIELLIR